MDYPMLAWIYWNPPRELFTIPFIERPIAIYGVCFVLGFVLGFFLLSNIFKYLLLRHSTIRAQDIADWPLIVKHLQTALEHQDHPAASIVKSLDRKMRQEIGQLQFKQEPHEGQKKAILAAINVSRLDRSTIEKLFPKGLVTARERGLMLTDKLTWFIILGTIIGARLGHVFFYEWPRYKDNLIDIIKVWEGGLASHGGLIAIMIALYFYYRLILKNYPEITFIGLMDAIAIPSPLAAMCIRIGNFFNQEILGPTTTLPWGIIFGDPMDGGPILPRHPSQLYEAGAYLAIFGLLFYLWQTKRDALRPGILSGLCLTLGFCFRFLIEFVKIPQSLIIDESFLQMGQYLSIPFIALGMILLFWGPRLNKSLAPAKSYEPL